MSTRGRASSTGGGAAMMRPSTHTTSPSATLVPSCAGASLTVTRPARIHSSTPRREPIPARASHFCRRSAMMFSVYGVGAGGLVDAVVIGRFVLRCDLVRSKRRRIGFCIGGDAFRLFVSRLARDRRQQAVDLGGDGLEAADFGERRQVAQVFDIEIIEKVARRAVERVLSRHLAVTDHAYPFALLQGLDDMGAHARAADVLDLGAAARLPIGDEHQRLEQRARITRRLFFTEPRDPLRVILFHLKAKATADFFVLVVV